MEVEERGERSKERRSSTHTPGQEEAQQGRAIQFPSQSPPHLTSLVRMHLQQCMGHTLSISVGVSVCVCVCVCVCCHKLITWGIPIEERFA